MLPPNVAREVTARLREGLADRGDIGRFLLDRIDEALAIGIEERQDDPETGRRPTGVVKQVVLRRAANDEEILDIHLRILHAYVIDLPDIEASAERALRDRFGVQSVVLALDTDEARDLNESREKSIRLAGVHRKEVASELRTAMVDLEAVVARAREEGVTGTS